jgi:hypothetical protein
LLKIFLFDKKEVTLSQNIFTEFIKMNDILIVPDVHGRDFWLPALDYPGEIKFLGDYTDPYPQEGITDEAAYEGLLKIVNFKQQNIDRVTLLIGNHDIHYFDDSHIGRAGRFSEDFYPQYNKIFTSEATKGLFQICRQIDKYLFTHAGVTKGWYDLHRNELKECGSTLEEQINNILYKKTHIFLEAAWKYRGGIDDFGSPVWADVGELTNEPEHFDHQIIQIIGHTQIFSREPYIKENFCLLDNRQLYLLHNNNIEKYPLN